MRQRGCLNARTNSLLRAIILAPGEGLLEKLASVSEDAELPLRMRLDSLKHLAGGLHGRIRISHAAKRQLADNFELETPE
jgi:hypothetical protein